MAAEPGQAFIWGAGGAQLTPEQIAVQRKIAQAMMERGSDYSPIQSPWQGVARVAESMMGGLESRQADEASKANASAESALLSSVFGGPAASTPAPAATPTASTLPAAAPAGPTAIPANKDEFIKTVMPLAAEASAKTGVDPRIIVAQAALETGWGKSAPGNNLFGIKSHGQPGGKVMPTTEVVNGQPVRTTDSFRAYASPAESAAGYADFINSNPRYAALKGAQGLDAQVAALGSSGYATDPSYGAKVGSIARSLPAGAVPAVAPVPAAAAPADGTIPAAAPQAAPAQAIPAGVNPALVRAMSSPYVSDGTKKILGVVLTQQMEAAKNAADPLRQLQIQQAQKSLGKSDAPNSVQEYEYYKAHLPAGQQPMDYGTWSTAKARASATTITNNVGDGETSFQKEAGKAQAQRFNDLAAEGQQAKQMIADVSTLTDLGKNIGTGKGAEFKARVGPYAEALGIKVDGLSDIQAYEAIVNRVAPTLRVKGSGAQSDFELKNFLKSLPSLGNTPEGNNIAASVLQGMQQNKVLASEIASKALNGEITKAEADKQLRELPDPMTPYREYTKASRAAPAKAAPAVPQPGDIQGGYRFKGGNPADPKSWEQVS